MGQIKSRPTTTTGDPTQPFESRSWGDWNPVRDWNEVGSEKGSECRKDRRE